ncbi:arginine--tRNA ligase [Geomicrobium sp. JCM 19055]|uniref:arginine--tRNA ligase n=1 Tax=Geomicrobium sp. JCM 19055 TaxID=1460649 RepID=UPI00045EDD73|nr:arginine--tRNA ligase [Geomicrobium sp. JCM 19055]GAJ97270.1 arginyl-tRNA synthetase [Geomicrobium sp. JCM 19055]
MNILDQAKEQMKEAIQAAVVSSGLASSEQVPDIILETPKDKNHGDFATNVAMQLTKIAKRNPREIAQAILDHLDHDKAYVKQADIAGPGFINLFLDLRFLRDVLPAVLTENQEYGRSNAGKGTSVLLEFVSANPTGTLHLGHARGAAVGDALSNILDMAGYQVEREYYINDAGNQIDNLAKSVEVRYLQAQGQEAEIPEDGYQGADIVEIGNRISEQYGSEFVEMDETERLRKFRELGLQELLEKLKQDLADFRVRFDTWFSETSLYTSGKVVETLETLRENGEAFDQDGATWFKSSAYGDDKDRVLVKQDGTYTYLLPDIAYHKDKLDRGFDHLVDLFGADHHGYIPRMQAAVQALGYPKDKLSFQIGQNVNLMRSGERVKMSKRTGNAVTMRELWEEVGLDATRYFFAMRSVDTHLDFDMDLAEQQSNENPVYYVQYAHARVSSLFKQAEEKGITYDEQSLNLELIDSDKAYELLKKIGEFPSVIAGAADQYAQHRIPNYLHELASTFHSYYNAERIVDESNKELTNVRLALVKAAQTVLRNGLTLIGVHAPEKM